MIEVTKLRQLAAHVRAGKLGHETFDFARTNDWLTPPAICAKGSCGTHGCAMGELPILFPDAWGFRDPNSGVVNQDAGRPYLLSEPDDTMGQGIEKFFGIDDTMVDHLFYPCGQSNAYGPTAVLHGEATREQVADHIEAFCRWAEDTEETR